MNAVDIINLQKFYGTRTIFEGITCVVEEGEKVGLIGRNGCGKSTLLRILSGDVEPDAGQIMRRRGLTVGYLPQEPHIDPALSIRSALEASLREIREKMSRFAQINEVLHGAKGSDVDRLLEEQGQLQFWLDIHGGWSIDHRIEEICLHLALPDVNQLVGTLSGGMCKRVALGGLLLTRPDLLLLDEPTNHLDADTIAWLETELKGYPGTVLLVTHDRYFLDRVADRMFELESGELTLYRGGYGDYLVQKQERLEIEGRAQSRLANILRREEAWLRRGCKARTTKQKARIGRVEELRDQRKEGARSDVRLDFGDTPRLGGTVLETSSLVIERGERRLVEDLDIILRRGERIGIVGPNGCGKSTLLATLLGDLPPQSGSVTIGPQVRIGYLDQARSGLDPEQFVHEALGDGEWVTLPGGRKRHKIGYLEDFLFTPDEQRKRISTLSGGERARLLLAKLILDGANLLVLDEPTNDIDIPTLQALEEAIDNFSGSLLVVTHDRYFLDRVVTGMLHFEGNGRVVFYEGNYDTFCRLKAQQKEPDRREKGEQAVSALPPRREKKRTGLSYKEKIELEEVERDIAELEEFKTNLERQLSDPSGVEGGHDSLEKIAQDFSSVEEKLSALYERWEVLETKREG